MGPTSSTSPRLRRRRSKERGQSLVEFAIGVPIFLLLLLGLVDVGNGVNAYLTVTSASRDAARLGSQGNATESGLLTMVGKETTKLPGGVPIVSETAATCGTGTVPGVCIDGVSANVTETTPGITGTGTSTNSNLVRVRVCYNQALILNFIGVLPSPLPLCSTTTMRKIT